MHSQLLIAILAGLGGMLGWGFADFCAKKTIDVIGAIKSLVWAHVFGTVLFAVLVFSQTLFAGHKANFPSSVGGWAGALFFGVLQMVVYWLAYEGFGKGQLAILNPIFAAYSGLVALASVVLYGEHVTHALALALVLLFFGVLLLNTDFQGLRNRKLNIVPGVKEVAAAALLAAGWTIGWDRFISGRDALPYTFLMYASMTVAAFIIAKLTRTVLAQMPRGLWKFVLLIGAGETLAYLAISWGYSTTSLTSVVALISGAFSIPTVVLSYIFLQERMAKLQAIAVILTVAGVVLVSLE
jgi:drug/metabolite transporter (DMT)-like permease